MIPEMESGAEYLACKGPSPVTPLYYRGKYLIQPVVNEMLRH